MGGAILSAFSIESKTSNLPVATDEPFGEARLSEGRELKSAAEGVLSRGQSERGGNVF